MSRSEATGTQSGLSQVASGHDFASTEAGRRMARASRGSYGFLGSPSATRQSPWMETHGFAPLPRGRFAFIVCNHRFIKTFVTANDDNAQMD